MTDQPPPPQPPQPPPGYGYPGPDPAPGTGNPFAAPQDGGPPKDGHAPGGYAQGGYAPGGYPPPGGHPPPGGYPPGGYPQGGYPPPGGYFPPPGTYTGDPNAPYGYDQFGRPFSEKSKIVAGVLQLFLGSLGVGRFYTGHIGLGLAQLFTCGGCGVWALVDGIIMLTSNQITDSDGRVLRS
ncbi:TM2 domain-containing protein [Streptomyces sp. NPDC091279]|uniref:TM2 domain-containing protein n=1 Tax=unclassified Streptomyces TaxID=2593676 RepID=UPI00380F750C